MARRPPRRAVRAEDETFDIAELRRALPETRARHEESLRAPQVSTNPPVPAYYGHTPLVPGYYSPVVYPQTQARLSQDFYPGPGYQGIAPSYIPGQYEPTRPAHFHPPSMLPPHPQAHYGQQTFPTTAHDRFPTGSSYSDAPSHRRPVLSSLRGPPRKPRQSGHALWVGNLPPGSRILDLKDHFSRDATADIQSVFLISRSNCAFVNYKTDGAMMAAMSRFQETDFNGARLVCRVRRTGSTSSESPTSIDPQFANVPLSRPPGQTAMETISRNRQLAAEAHAIVEAHTEGTPLQELPPETKDRYFVLKSLTVEDMVLSVSTGIWATQPHNEETLNEAFQSSRNVYLIFSANKSGEYFGYARMASSIQTGQVAMPPRSQPVVLQQDVHGPSATVTEPTRHAPRGRLIDDSARGTIFWESDYDDDHRPDDIASVSEESEPGTESPGGAASGRPFRVDWQTTCHLPFYRARGLRNPWNANREVKIARDGTELETNVGRALIELFGMRPSRRDSPSGHTPSASH